MYSFYINLLCFILNIVLVFRRHRLIENTRLQRSNYRFKKAKKKNTFLYHVQITIKISRGLKTKNTDESFSVKSYWFTIHTLVQQILDSSFIFYASSNRISTAILHDRVVLNVICYLIYYSLKFPYKTLHVFLKMTV